MAKIGLPIIFMCKDVRNVYITELPGEVELARASFPCQDLSLAGNGAGLKANVVVLSGRSGNSCRAKAQSKIILFKIFMVHLRAMASILLLACHGFQGSMSRKGNCRDNAVMERFFLNLKMEHVWHRQYANHNEAICDATDYIVNFYNSRRMQSSLGYLPSNDYEMKRPDQQPILLSEKC